MSAAPNISQNKNKEVFENMPVPKAVATLAIPTIISQLVVLIYNLADTFFIGHTNNPFMVAGVSLILPIFNITTSLSGLAGVGGGSLISRLLGKQDSEQALKVSSFSFYLAIGIAAFFSVITMLFMDPMLTMLGAGPDTMDYAKQYVFTVICLGAIPTVLSMTMGNLLRSCGFAKQAGFGISMGGLINIALDPLFMYVLFPDGMQAAGAGLATMCSNVIACGYFFFVIYKIRHDSVITFRPTIGIPRKDSILSIFAVGLPSCIATLLFDIDYMFIDKLVSGYGDHALAAIGIVLKAERLPLNIGIGLCLGMMPIVAYNYSAGNYDRMKQVIRFTRNVGITMALISLAMYETFAGGIINIFIKEANTVGYGVNFLRIRACATPLMFMSFRYVYTFNAMGKGKVSLSLAVIRWACLNIPIMLILNFFFGLYGVIWTQFVADIGTVTVSMLIYKNYLKKNGI